MAETPDKTLLIILLLRQNFAKKNIENTYLHRI